MYNEVILHEWKINLKERNNILKMHSLIHDQLSSTRFQPLILYAWFRAGYQVPQIIYESVLDVCFPKQVASCSIEDCENHSFIKCSWCSLPLCFMHFFEVYHNHLE
jgi:hypothetical protein